MSSDADGEVVGSGTFELVLENGEKIVTHLEITPTIVDKVCQLLMV